MVLVKQFMAVTVALIVVFTSIKPVNAQTNIDCADVEGLVEGLVNLLQDNVENLEDLSSLVLALRIITVECDIQQARFFFSPLEDASSDMGSNADPAEQLGILRSEPMPLLGWFKFSKGQVRVVSVEDYDEYETYSVAEGMRVIAVNIEYLCEKEDENETCRGTEVGGGSYVTIDGIVLGDAPIYNSENLRVVSDGHEVYSGTTITGRTYFTIGIGENPNIMRLNLDSAPVFFSLD